MIAAPQPLLYDELVRAALREDLGLGGDLTSDAIVGTRARARATFIARAPGTIAGLSIAARTIEILDPEATLEGVAHDGDVVEAHAPLLHVEADARALLAAERTALNLLSHLSGIATATARFVAAVAGTRAAIAETRKTLPGLRALAKYAVRVGGGRNHRYRLDDAVLIKDNHIALAGGVTQALDRVHARIGHLTALEIEVDTLVQLHEVLVHPRGANAILLDNFDVADLRVAVGDVAGRARLEASGNVRLETIRAIAETGVDVISIGALTHSVTALDIALDF